MPHKKPGPTKMLQRDNGAFDDSQHMVTFSRPRRRDLEFGTSSYSVKYI